MRAAILLAACNGEAYLQEQLDSIFDQALPPGTVVLARDDRSDDQTPAILQQAAANHPELRILEGPPGRIGAAENFSFLMQVALDDGTDYVFFADQDDAWLPGKVERQLARARQEEEQHGKNCPVLVHTDLQVTNAKLEPIASSFMQYQGIHHQKDDPLGILLIQNFVTGCSMMINRALLERALPVPKEAIMHDWWCALLAAAAGRLVFIPEATVKYRQHDANAIGAKHLYSQLNIGVDDPDAVRAKGHQHYLDTMTQAGVLAERLDAESPARARIQAYHDVQGSPLGLKAALILRRLKVRRQHPLKHVLFILHLLLSRPGPTPQPRKRVLKVVRSWPCLASLAVLGIVCFHYVDAPVALHLATYGNEPWHDGVRSLSKLANATPWLILSAALAGFGFVRRMPLLMKNALFILCTIAAPGLLNIVLKILLGRPRPGYLFQGEPIGFRFWEFDSYLWSMPSGHAFTMASLTMGLSLLYPRISGIVLPIGILMASTRVIITAHFVSDVLVGLLLGYLGALVMYRGFYQTTNGHE